MCDWCRKPGHVWRQCKEKAAYMAKAQHSASAAAETEDQVLYVSAEAMAVADALDVSPASATVPGGPICVDSGASGHMLA